MASHRSKKTESCAHENCGSRRFHVGEDGFTYCDQGHQQSERGTLIAEDTGEMVLLGRTSRKKDSDAESATSRASSFSGSHAFEHYLLCIQLVLRKQLYWLTSTQNLPAELESLVKDLWALRLQKVQTRIGYESETDTEAPSSQVFSSQSESEATSASRSTRRSRKQRERVHESAPRPLETVALCYIGMLFLRVPITIADMHRWVNDGQLLYHRTIREVPLGMRERLPPRYQAQLDPQDLLRASSLHEQALKLLKTFHADLGMSPPVLNVPLILDRWMRELMLPLEVYAGTKRLAHLLDIKFEFSMTTKSARLASWQYPEVRMMAVVVVATKLLFPFDDIERYTRSSKDLSSVRMHWDAWMKQNDRRKDDMSAGQTLSFEEAFNFDETGCRAASDDKLDAYLDWYEDNIATEDIRERGRARKDAELRRAMFAMFPTQERSRHSIQGQSSAETYLSFDARLRKVQSELRPRPVHDSRSSDADAHPVGSKYRRFRDAGELSGVAKVFYEQAAEVVGVSLEEMVKMTFFVERKMEKYEERLRKEDDG